MTWQLSIDNIAGIRHAEADIEPGVNAVRASNWQGKSSFLAGIETAFGTETPLTEGAEAGGVTLSTEDDRVDIDLVRTDGTVSRTGTPYLRDEYDRVCADLFAFLDEDNEVRRAVRNGNDIERLLLRPLDFENIDEQIATQRAEREQVATELERAEDAADRLPTLQERTHGLESKLEELRTERRSLEDATADGDGSSREELSSLRAERDRVASRIDRLETTVESVRERLSDARAELDALSVPADTDIEAELEAVSEDLRAVERDRELLQSVFEANRRVLDEGEADLLTDVSRGMLGDTVECWVCGREAAREELEAKLSAYDGRISDLRSEAAAHRERIEELERERDEVRTARRRESDLENRIGELESKLAEDEEALENARDRRAELEESIETLAAAVDTTADRITELESEIKYTEAELEDAADELETVETRADQRDALSAEYDELSREIADLRNRRDEVRRRAREAFSSALADLSGRFDTGFETARLTADFTLVVARDGRETRLAALSEGERELLGFVAALAGHEAFDVGDSVPVLLLDGLGGLASDNLARLVDYLTGHAEYLVLTAYPEHECFDGNELSPSDWEVVSTDSDVTGAP